MKRILFTIFTIFSITITRSEAQQSNIIPPSPQAASLGKFGEIPLNYSTGALNMSIPLISLTEGDLSLAGTLNYNYNGFKPSEEPGWVGLGWSLNVGGVITRVVQGVKDELGNRGYFSKGAQVQSFVDSPTIAKIMSLYPETGYADSQPDIFYFNFDGHSGKFVFDENRIPRVISAKKIKIEIGAIENNLIHSNSDENIASFIITTEDGTKYFFSNVEFTRKDVNSEIVWVTSSWYLTQKISTTGSYIKYQYTPINSSKTRVSTSISETQLAEFYATGIVGTHQSSGINISYNFFEEIFPSKIVGTNWEVEFVSTEKTKFIPPYNSYTRKLDTIKIYDLTTSKKLRKNIIFTYSTESSKRLLLNSVQEYVNESEKIPPYTFYYNTAPPDYLNGDSMSIDYWGYYNGQPNTSLIPINVGNADREPRFNYTVMGALSTIQYPTGGSVNISYEQNTYSYNQANIAEIKKIVDSTRTFWWDVTSAGTFKSTNTPVIITTPTKCKIKLKAQGQSNQVCYSYNNNNLNNYQEILLQPGTYNDVDFLNLGIFYPCNQTINDIGTSIIIDLTIFYETVVNVGSCGGIRVKSMIDFPNVKGNSVPLIRSFFYNDFENPNLSSGMLGAKLYYSTIVNGSGFSFLLKRSEPYNTMSLLPLYYYNVEERIGFSRRLFTYTSYKTVADKNGKSAFLYTKAQTSTYTSLSSTGNKDIGSYESYDFARFLPKSTSFKDLSNGITTYSSNSNYEIDAPINQIPGIYTEYLGAYQTSPPFNDPSSESSVKVYYVKTYNTITGWPKLISEEVIDNGSTGASPFSTISQYFYENPLHLQLTKKKTLQSDGSILETKFKYPIDYINITGKAPFISEMVKKNMISIPLEKVTIHEKNSVRKIVNADISTHKIYSNAPNTNDSLVLPYKKFTFIGANSILENNFIFFDGLSDSPNLGNYREILNYNYTTIYQAGNLGSSFKGFLKEEIRNQGLARTAYLWSYNWQYPVAKLENVDFSNITLALTAAGSSVELMGQNNNEATLINTVNTLRDNLPGALTTSYTYKPQIGLTSITSPNKLSTYYQYDNLGRLSTIKDHNKYILKSYLYHYSGQIGEIYSTVDWDASAISCTANTNGTSTMIVGVKGLISGSNAEFSVDGGPWQQANIGSSYFQVTLPSSPAGVVGFRARATDLQGREIIGFLTKCQ